ncbi:DUF6954 family protein [Bacillus suaedaesalsae]|uniref:Uncharacterized protein n=1 Tax=Bacillus suaedaesalsae TaxID=2810349 RepID=A0ABS2DGQ2_9BACI|nr:hypothetical protein [Bacillus suaedaesalsae]MBM6617662.1 hypothetical protein [Bacillus suaedaesalsae]
MKWIIITLFSILVVLIMFFGLGPVLLADGSEQERIITLAIVLLLFVAISISIKILLKKFK